MLDFENDIKHCVTTIQNSGIILYPTDTIWGLGCNALDSNAIEKIDQLKNRPGNKSYIVLMSDARQLRQYIATPLPDLETFIEQFENPTTIIYPNAINLPDALIAEDGSIAVRITKDAFCHALIKRLRTPLVSTSANYSGSKSPSIFKDIDNTIIQQVDYCVQYRLQEVNAAAPSSIYKLLDDETLVQIR